MEYQRTKLYNQRSAEKALILAKELIEEQGKTVEPTNPKILAPWLEGVSLEDPEDETVIELFANILARGDKSTVTEQIVMINFCKSLGSFEADRFLKIMEFFDLEVGGYDEKRLESENGVGFGLSFLALLDSSIDSVEELSSAIERTKWKKLGLLKFAWSTNKKISVTRPKENDYADGFPYFATEVSNEHTVSELNSTNEDLVHLGLLRLKNLNFEFEKFHFHYAILLPTNLGAKFYKVVST